MIKKNRYLILPFAFFGLLSGMNPAWGAGTGYIYKRIFSLPPSFPDKPTKETFGFSCYDISTFQLLDCAFTYRITGLKSPVDDIANNGGHTHNYDTHPLIEPPDGSLGFDGVDKDPANKLGVIGQTLYAEAHVTYTVPQVSSKIVAEATMTLPSNWVCVYNCFTSNSWRWEYTFDVGIERLGRLPDSGDYHVVMRGGTDTHPEGTYGMPISIEILNEIAKKYKKLTGRKLSINDISLPKGGVFDVCNTYNPKDTCPAASRGGHFEHRIGNDADINRTDGGGVSLNCATLEKVVNLPLFIVGHVTP